MNNKFLDSIKHVIIEDDDPKAQAPAQPSQPQAAVPLEPAATIVTPPSASSQPMPEEVDRVYQRILAKTNFEQTAVAATIHKYLDPLAAIPNLDERTRFKTAVIQAKAQEGLTQERILATFDGLKVALQNEQESFATSAQATRQREIADRERRVKEINDAITSKQREIAELQQQLSEMSNELAGAQGKIQRAESQFHIAAQRRAVEIDQEKAKYVSLLQG
ncbi:MAG TPA: hypothetical protein VKV39_03890 [Candidatus Sulfotelmatobacter sp.]|nr:hypothetical protein [Candidatus Sulfotelmatobacter sp.]